LTEEVNEIYYVMHLDYLPDAEASGLIRHLIYSHSAAEFITYVLLQTDACYWMLPSKVSFGTIDIKPFSCYDVTCWEPDNLCS
jgi:hypothetical protein